MAPEYAFDGLFSTKSDVFSFGILLLEIVSGKKSRGLYNQEHSLNLIGYVKSYIKSFKSSFWDMLDLRMTNLNCNAFRHGNCGMKADPWTCWMLAWGTQSPRQRCCDVCMLVSYACSSVRRIGRACHLLF